MAILWHIVGHSATQYRNDTIGSFGAPQQAEADLIMVVIAAFFHFAS